MPATEQIWRPLPKMHRIFAFSAIVLLAATFLMMAKDEARDWRSYQTAADKLKIEQLRDQLKPYRSKEFKDAEAAKVAAVKAAQEKQDDPKVRERIAELERRRRELQAQVDLVSRETKFKNAERDVARANFDLNVRDAKPRNVLTSRLNDFDQQAGLATENLLKLQQIQAELRLVKDELTEIYAEKTAADADLTKFRGDRTRLYEQLYKISPNDEALPDETRSSFAAAKRALKELPILNGFNPHHAIQYDWPKDLEIQLGMARVSRVDRCRSCHLNINDFGPGNVPNFPKDKYHEPFTSHPNADLFLSSASPHPIERFGCTVCHDGDGSGTSFQAAEHTPRDPAQATEWADKYGWHSNHFWEYPMQPGQFIESSCLKCHHSVVELGVNAKYGATAPKVFEGYELIKSYGCFGCHEINGYDGTRPIGPDMRLEPNSAAELAAIEADPNAPPPGNLRKVGPSLRHVGSKVAENFISYWTEDPQRFRPSTKMPKFFGLENQHDNLAHVLQPVELEAIEAYLNAKSEPIALSSPAEGYTPDAERGKIAFQRRGCLACHTRDEEELKDIKSDFGPNITNIHEKLKPGQDGFRWLYSWLKNPELHHPRTRMPNLYLNPETVGGEQVDPAADIAAYLLQGGPKQFPQQAVGGPSLGLVYDKNFTQKTADSLRAEHRGVRVIEVLQTGAGSRALSLDVSGKPPVDGAGNPKSDFQRLAPIKRDDIVLEFNSQPVTSNEQLDQLAASAGLGAKVTLKLFSDGLERLVEVRISTPLEDLTRLYLSKSLPDAAQVDKALADRRYAYQVPAYAYQPKPDGTAWNFREWVKGDEIELIARSQDEQVSEATWATRQMEYIGRRTISRYGCYACHDIPGFEDAKPIGTALQDWGRKDTSKLAPEHILEFLHHHGEPDGASTHERIESIVKRGIYDKDTSAADRSAASFYQSLEHHGRPGFIWQKLREPRSYDFRKTESKGWDERLKMPKFPINEQQIESIATFVLGLVNDPPAPQYQYRPTGPARDVIEGERLVDKYNCTGCHIFELPSLTYKGPLQELIGASKDELTTWFISNSAKIETGAITQEALAGRAAADAVEPEAMRSALATFITNSERLLEGTLPQGVDPKTGLATYLAGLARRGGGQPLREFFKNHPETLVADAFPPADHPDALRLLLKLKPGVSGLKGNAGKDGLALIQAHGLLTGVPDPEEEDPELRMYGLDLWQTLDLAGRIKLPGSKAVVQESNVVAKHGGRGGDLAHWLVAHLRDELQDVNKAWQASPPPLYKEGIKVQTPWLFRFLKNPEQLRYTTVLRMPRFNMSDQEAQTLANYFAAVDNVEYPYQSIPQQEPQFLVSMEEQFKSAHAGVMDGYELQAWKTLNGPLCAKCHQVGGKPYKSTDPKDIRGPNLERVEKRLQGDWTRAWIYKPTWFTPYTSMPVNFPADKPPFPDLFGASSREQVEGVVFSLMNYSRILEKLGVVAYEPPTPAEQTPPPAPQTSGGEE